MSDTLPQWQPASVRPPDQQLLIRYLCDGVPCLAFAYPSFGLKSPWRDAFVKSQYQGRDSLTKEELECLLEADLDNPEHTHVHRWHIPQGGWRETVVDPEDVTHWTEAA